MRIVNICRVHQKEEFDKRFSLIYTTDHMRNYDYVCDECTNTLKTINKIQNPKFCFKHKFIPIMEKDKECDFCKVNNAE